MSRFFFGFHRKLAHTKTQQSTDKASKHNARTVFSRFLVLLMCVSTEVVWTSSFILYPQFILLPYYLRQRPFSPPPPPPTECAAAPARAGIIKSNNLLPLTADEALAATEPLLWPLRFQRRICCHACCRLQQRPPFPLNLAIFRHCHHR